MGKLKSILSKVLEIEEDKITDDISKDNTETWDSFNGLMLISELEKEFSIKLTIGEAIAIKSVKDIRNALKKHGVDLDEPS